MIVKYKENITYYMLLQHGYIAFETPTQYHDVVYHVKYCAIL